MKRLLPFMIFGVCCGGTLLLDVVLTRMLAENAAIERLMGGQMEDWVVALVAAFLLTRFLVYLVLPAAIAAFCVYHVIRSIQRGLLTTNKAK